MRAVVIGLAVTMVGAGAVGCGAGGPEIAGVSSAPRLASLVEGVSVATARVERGSVQRELSAAGTIQARRTTPIGPAVPGRIVSVQVDVGDRAETGDPLFEIDPTPYRIALQSAEAGLALARAELGQARGQAERSQALRRKHMVSAEEFGAAQTRARVAEARVQQAEAQRARAREDLDRTVVRAPYAGSIVERRQHEGAMATVGPGAAVVVLQESDALVAVVDVPEASLATVRPGDAARLRVEGVAKPIGATVASVSDRIDPATRTYSVRIPILDPTGRAKAGSFVRCDLIPQSRHDRVVLPRSALVRREGGVFAFRIRDGVAERVRVRVGVLEEQRAEILEGLSPGDEVVVGPDADRLEDGERVRASGGGRA